MTDSEKKINSVTDRLTNKLLCHQVRETMSKKFCLIFCFNNNVKVIAKSDCCADLQKIIDWTTSKHNHNKIFYKIFALNTNSYSIPEDPDFGYGTLDHNLSI